MCESRGDTGVPSCDKWLRCLRGQPRPPEIRGENVLSLWSLHSVLYNHHGGHFHLTWCSCCCVVVYTFKETQFTLGFIGNIMREHTPHPSQITEEEHHKSWRHQETIESDQESVLRLAADTIKLWWKRSQCTKCSPPRIILISPAAQTASPPQHTGGLWLSDKHTPIWKCHHYY